jgi:hypothetical protein
VASWGDEVYNFRGKETAIWRKCQIRRNDMSDYTVTIGLPDGSDYEVSFPEKLADQRLTREQRVILMLGEELTRVRRTSDIWKRSEEEYRRACNDTLEENNRLFRELKETEEELAKCCGKKPKTRGKV